MIQEKAMLATLSISQWTARKHDKKISTEVEKTHAAHDAGRFNKLLVNKSILDDARRCGDALREYHYRTTLPWADNGARLLPSKLFMDYTINVRKFREKFNAAVDELVAKYPAEVQAARTRLGTMYRPEDYPAASDIRGRFGVTVGFEPISTAADFRVDVSTEAVEEIKASISESLNSRQAAAMKDCYDRIREVVSKLSERLSDDKAIFKDSLIGNVVDLMAVLPGLNFTNDPVIDTLHQEITDMLLVPPQVLRTDLTRRKETADAADAILAKLPWK